VSTSSTSTGWRAARPSSTGWAGTTWAPCGSPASSPMQSPPQDVPRQGAGQGLIPRYSR
jgi:hypothetical protein